MSLYLAMSVLVKKGICRSLSNEDEINLTWMP
jgi:hypothetical protein